MNKLGYCISLREKGLTSNDIKKKMKERWFEESEIQHYLKKSDKIFLNQLIHNKKSKSSGKLNNGIKTIALALSLILLISAFYGYTTIGLLGLFFIWGLVKLASIENNIKIKGFDKHKTSCFLKSKSANTCVRDWCGILFCA